MESILLTQYLRPDGRKEIVNTEVEDNIAEMAAGVIMSVEVLRTGEVGIWVKYPDWEEEDELHDVATNGPGERSPKNILSKLIKECHRIGRRGNEQTH